MSFRNSCLMTSICVAMVGCGIFAEGGARGGSHKQTVYVIDAPQESAQRSASRRQQAQRQKNRQEPFVFPDEEQSEDKGFLARIFARDTKKVERRRAQPASEEVNLVQSRVESNDVYVPPVKPAPASVDVDAGAHITQTQRSAANQPFVFPDEEAHEEKGFFARLFGGNSTPQKAKRDTGGFWSKWFGRDDAEQSKVLAMQSSPPVATVPDILEFDGSLSRPSAVKQGAGSRAITGQASPEPYVAGKSTANLALPTGNNGKLSDYALQAQLNSQQLNNSSSSNIVVSSGADSTAPASREMIAPVRPSSMSATMDGQMSDYALQAKLNTQQLNTQAAVDMPSSVGKTMPVASVPTYTHGATRQVEDVIDPIAVTVAQIPEERRTQLIDMSRKQPLLLPEIDVDRDVRKVPQTLMKNVTIQSLGRDYWILTQYAKPRVWDILDIYLNRNAIDVVGMSLDKGVLETQWLARSNDSGTVDKYRLELQPGLQAGTSEISVTHRAASANNRMQIIDWSYPSSTQDKELDFLKSLARFIDEQEWNADTRLDQETSRLAMLQQDGQPFLKMHLSQDRAWAAALQAISRSGQRLKSADPNRGLMVVDYRQHVYDSEGVFTSLFKNKPYRGDLYVLVRPLRNNEGVGLMLKAPGKNKLDSYYAKSILLDLKRFLN